MTDLHRFAAALLEYLIADIIRDKGRGPVVMAVVDIVRQRFANDSATITGPIEEALKETNLALTPTIKQNNC